MGLASAALRKLSASLGNRIATLPEMIASLRGPLGDSVKNRLPGASLQKISRWETCKFFREYEEYARSITL